LKNKTKYILTKHERMLRIEEVEYVVEIPETVKNKLAYADRLVMDGDCLEYKVVDIPMSERLDEEAIGLREAKV
jgi:hypothetical protein